MTHTNSWIILIGFLLLMVSGHSLQGQSITAQRQAKIPKIAVRIQVADSTISMEELETISFFLENLSRGSSQIISFRYLQDSLRLPARNKYRLDLHSYDNSDHFFFLNAPIEFSTPLVKKELLVELQVGDENQYLVEKVVTIPSQDIRVVQPSVAIELQELEIKGVDRSELEVYAPVEFDSMAIQSLVTEISDEQLKERITARILESIPDTMYLEEREILSIVISADTTEAFLTDFIASDPVFQEHPERVESFLLGGVGNIMISRLIDVDSAFSIQPLFAKSQRFVDFVTTEPQRWEWYVTPRLEGKHLLTYALERIDIRDGKEFTSSIASVLEKDVLVVVKEGEAEIPIVEESKSFAWIWLLVGMSVLGGGIFLFSRQRQQQQQQATVRVPARDIRNAIIQGKPEKALDLLSAAGVALSSNWQREITLLQGRWSSLESDLNKGTISNQEAQIERNRIKDRILDIVDELS
jgi:hypothetical protein